MLITHRTNIMNVNVMNATNAHGRKLSAKIAIFGLLLAALIVNGCASSDGKAGLKLGPDLGMPAPGKSKVVFLRPGHTAWAVHFRVHDGEKWIGRSSSSSYFVYECDPGRHFFSTSMDNVAFFNADLLPDRIYYVRVKAVMGLWVAGVRMYALYPGCAEINWGKMPKILAELEEEGPITNEEQENDKVKLAGYMERVKAHQNNPEQDFDAEKVLPEFGQTTPLSPQ